MYRAINQIKVEPTAPLYCLVLAQSVHTHVHKLAYYHKLIQLTIASKWHTATAYIQYGTLSTEIMKNYVSYTRIYSNHIA